MSEYPIEIQDRHITRMFSKAIGRSIYKILSELITNSDDSYGIIEREELKTSESTSAPCSIVIEFDRKRGHFTVIDNAQGLTDEEMKEKFVKYGGDSSDRDNGYKTRGLFGKGLKDVLFTQKFGQVKSIKNGIFYNCQFRCSKKNGSVKYSVNIKEGRKVDDKLRKALRIPGNGTRVEFALSDSMPKPQPDKLISRLSNFYMLRIINNNPNRQVLVRILTGRRIEKQLRFDEPEAEIAKHVQFDMKLKDGEIIPVECDISVATTELPQGEVGIEERVGGLLVIDENHSVLDLNLFGFDDDPYARRLVGRVKLEGAGAYIRKKLNDLEPEELLTDTRDGLDKNNDLYRQLKNMLSPYISPIVAEQRRTQNTRKNNLSSKFKKRHEKAIEELNRVASDMLKGAAKLPIITENQMKPPEDGIGFLTSHVSIQTGIVTPLPLLINNSMLIPGERVEISCNNRDIAISPSSILIEPKKEAKDVSIKMLTIKSDYGNIEGEIVALWSGVEKRVKVNTIDREIITPLDGLQFEKEEYRVNLGSQRILKLFVDIKKIPIGSEIKIQADKGNIIIVSDVVIVTTENIISPDIAEVKVTVKAKEKGKDISLKAMNSKYVTGTSLSVKKKEDNKNGKGGLFNDYKFQDLTQRVQTFYYDGDILINLKDPVNNRYFGDEPYQSVENEVYSQVRLADLILNECLQVMVSKALESGTLDRRFPDNLDVDVRTYVDEKKFEIGPVIHDLFVTKL